MAEIEEGCKFVGARGGKCRCKALEGGLCRKHGAAGGPTKDVSQMNQKELDKLRAEIRKREFVLELKNPCLVTRPFDAELQEVNVRDVKVQRGASTVTCTWKKGEDDVVVKSELKKEVTLTITYQGAIWKGSRANYELREMLNKLGYEAECPLGEVLARIGASEFIVDHPDFAHRYVELVD
jgi:hypothetical protein